MANYFVVTGAEYAEGENAKDAYYYLAVYEYERATSATVTGISYYTEERETFARGDVTDLPEERLGVYLEAYANGNYEKARWVLGL